jgi:hypothetical protein
MMPAFPFYALWTELAFGWTAALWLSHWRAFHEPRVLPMVCGDLDPAVGYADRPSPVGRATRRPVLRVVGGTDGLS